MSSMSDDDLNYFDPGTIDAETTAFNEEIEKQLYQREKSLFNLEDCIFLYDLTNTYFEGVCSLNPKAQFNGNQKETDGFSTNSSRTVP